MRTLGRLLAVLVVLAVVAAGVVLLGDGAARSAAEQSTATTLQQKVPFTSQPSVTINGWPFLLDVIRGLPSVHVRASGLPTTVRNQQITLSDPDFTLTDVHLSLTAITASGLTGSVALPYAELSRVVGGTVTFVDGGRVQFKGHVTLFERQLDATASGVPSLDVAGQTVTMKDAAVSVSGVAVPQVPVDALASVLAPPVSFPLPYGLKLSSVTATPAGLVFQVAGTNVAFPTA